MLQFLKSVLLVFSPCPGSQPCELGERFHNLRIVLDEFSVEVCESKEQLEFPFLRGHRPFCNAGDLNWVHSDRVLANDHPEVFRLKDFEFAFFCFEKSLCLRRR